MPENRFECPQCGAKTELAYISPDKKIIGIRCSKVHVYEEITVTSTREIIKPSEVFFIELNEEERQLYDNNRLRVAIRDYHMPEIFKESFKRGISIE